MWFNILSIRIKQTFKWLMMMGGSGKGEGDDSVIFRQAGTAMSMMCTVLARVSLWILLHFFFYCLQFVIAYIVVPLPGVIFEFNALLFFLFYCLSFNFSFCTPLFWNMWSTKTMRADFFLLLLCFLITSKLFFKKYEIWLYYFIPSPTFQFHNIFKYSPIFPPKIPQFITNI